MNPLAEKFLPGSPVPRQRREAFQRHLAALLERLDREAPLAALDHPASGPTPRPEPQ